MTDADQLGWRAAEVLHRYCRAIDDHDAVALAAVFAPDVELVVGGETTEGGDGSQQSFAGRDLVVQLLSSLFEQRNWARHSVANVLVGPGPDGTLVVDSYFNYLLAKAESRVVGVGDYHVDMLEIDGHLLITRFSAAILDEVEIPR